VSVKRMDHAVVDVHGVGYHVSIPLSTYYVLPDPPESVMLFTMLHVREDAMPLYGFATPDERAVFELLVGGVVDWAASGAQHALQHGGGRVAAHDCPGRCESPANDSGDRQQDGRSDCAGMTRKSW